MKTSVFRRPPSSASPPGAQLIDIPTDTDNPTFTATLSPANEVTRLQCGVTVQPVKATITLVTKKMRPARSTAATATFVANYPASQPVPR